MAWGLWVDLASGALLVLAATAVLITRPTARLNRAFATFAGSLGIGFVALNSALALRGRPDAEVPLLWTTAVCIIVAAAALFRLIGLFPRPATAAERGRLRQHRRWLAVAALAYFATAPFLAAQQAPVWAHALGYSSAATLPYYVILAGARLYNGAVWMFGAWMALRFLALPAQDERRRRECASGVVFILLYPLAFVGVTLLSAPTKAAGLLDLAAIALVAFVWLYAGARSGHPRTGRNLAWFLLGTTLAFLLLGLSGRSFAGIAVSGLLGLSRTLAVLVLAYVILRHQLFDIDVRLKVTLRRSTVLAAFGAAFFIGSELLERLIDVNGILLGLLAAAAVTLGLRPLQHAAHRVAERILPGVDADERLLQRKLSVYRGAFDADAADGTVSARERALLEALRRELGLTPSQAARIETEARRALAA